MHLTAASPESTPGAIIDAAERLFGLHGIEGVSLRQISLSANAANNSAIRYHFGDRRDLVQAIWEHRLPLLEEIRTEMIEDASAKGLLGDPHELIRLFVEPCLRIRDSEGYHRYASFMRHALRWRETLEIRNRTLEFTPASRKVLDLFKASHPDVPWDLTIVRLRYGICLLFDMISDRDLDISTGRHVIPVEQLMAEGVDMLVAICARPLVSG
ncbi:MAG: TetR/AcrR family transcriptional regulator [Sphingomonadaceae bacterium]